MDWLIDLIFSILIAVAASSIHMTDLHRHNSVTCPDAGAFTPVCVRQYTRRVHNVAVTAVGCVSMIATSASSSSLDEQSTSFSHRTCLPA